MKTPRKMRLEHDAWRQVFCAALTGVLAGKNEPNVGDADDPYRDEAFDAVMFASQVADEAFTEREGN